MKGMRHVATLSGVALVMVHATAGTVTFTEETDVRTFYLKPEKQDRGCICDLP